jgi:hypothetical protein
MAGVVAIEDEVAAAERGFWFLIPAVPAPPKLHVDLHRVRVVHDVVGKGRTGFRKVGQAFW